MRLFALALVGASGMVVGVACSGGETSAIPESDASSPTGTPPSGSGTTSPSGNVPTDAMAPLDASPDARPSDAGPDAPGPFVDSCSLQAAPACPTLPAALTEGSGLRAIDRCAFPMAAAAGFGQNSALLDALEKLAPKVSVSDVIADANRIATRSTSVPGNPAGVGYAFRWNAEDDDSTTWIPQGITGTPDADSTGIVGGKRAVLVSFYEDTTLGKGVRIAFTDLTDPAAPKYRFALLVEPKGSVTAPTFGVVDVHAGGIVWFGTRLYVAQTGTGFRVFDMSRILRVAVDQDTIGCTTTTCRAGLYKYVVPQIGTYVDKSACAPIFSWVSLDRSTTPPALVSGEYCTTGVCPSPIGGRVFRWPLDPSTGLLRGATTYPLDAHYTSHRQNQGGASRNGTFYFSSSAPAGGGGALYRTKIAKSATSVWSDAPEDLMVDEGRGLLWSLVEAPGSRVVFGAAFTSYPAPP